MLSFHTEDRVVRASIAGHGLGARLNARSSSGSTLPTWTPHGGRLYAVPDRLLQARVTGAVSHRRVPQVSMALRGTHLAAPPSGQARRNEGETR